LKKLKKKTSWPENLRKEVNNGNDKKSFAKRLEIYHSYHCSGARLKKMLNASIILKFVILPTKKV